MVDDDASRTVDTAVYYSRVPKPRRKGKVYGTVGDEVESETLLTAKDLAPMAMENTVTFHLGDDQDFGGNEEEHDFTTTDEDTLHVDFTKHDVLPETNMEDCESVALDGERDDGSVHLHITANNHEDEPERIEKDKDPYPYEPVDDVNPRPSQRTSKSPQSVLEELMPSSTKTQLDEDSLIASIDGLFVHADKKVVTVKDVFVALEAEYGVELNKKTKAYVRNHLKNLVHGTLEPTIAAGSDEGGMSDEENGAHEDASEPELEDDNEDKDNSSDFAEDERNPKGKSKLSKRELKYPRRSTKTKKPSAIRIHAKILHKKRMEELRVRREEMQVQLNKEDQELAEQIAARFDTNTKELKLKRLEDRLDLLEKLDQRRIQVLTAENKRVEGEEGGQRVTSTTSTSTSDSDSDSDSELEIVDEVHRTSIECATTEKSIGTNGSDTKAETSSIIVEEKQISWSEVAVRGKSSPGTSLSVRASLRRTLLSKQRKMGNLWLAREMGYSSEQDHLRACHQAKDLKRSQVIKIEEARLKANSHKRLRERMLFASEEAVGDDDVDEGEEEWKDDGEERGLAAKAIDDDDADQTSETNGLQVDYEGDLGAFDDEDDGLLITAEHEATDSNEVDQSVALERRSECESFDNDVEARDVCARLLDVPVDTVITNAPVSGGKRENLGDVVEDDSMGKVDAGDEGQSLAETVGSQHRDDSKDSSTTATGSTNDSSPEQQKHVGRKSKAKNSGWQEMLKKEAEQLKRLKGRNGSGLVEAEADEEEEKDVVAGLEDFGFSVGKKKKDEKEDEESDDDLDEEDLKFVVDDLSNDEGDEEAGERARKELMKREEKAKHKEMMRRVREGYDGRRRGIAGGGVGARGLHRFHQLVAADNREDAKRLGLLNEDELDSDDEDGGKIDSGKGIDDADDEVALFDQMLKDRFLHRSSAEMEEHFSDDEDHDKDIDDLHERLGNEEDAEEREQERLAKRFAKRARIQRLLEAYGDDEEFSQLRLIDEDERMKEELAAMKDVVGLTRRQYSGSSNLQSAFSNSGGDSQLGSSSKLRSLFATKVTGSLVLALKACHLRKNKTSFLGGSLASKGKVSAIHKSVSLNHVIFHPKNSQSRGSVTPSAATRKRKRAPHTSSILWDKVASNNFRQKKRR